MDLSLQGGSRSFPVFQQHLCLQKVWFTHSRSKDQLRGSLCKKGCRWLRPEGLSSPWGALLQPPSADPPDPVALSLLGKVDQLLAEAARAEGQVQGGRGG